MFKIKVKNIITLSKKTVEANLTNLLVVLTNGKTAAILILLNCKVRIWDKMKFLLGGFSCDSDQFSGKDERCENVHFVKSFI